MRETAIIIFLIFLTGVLFADSDVVIRDFVREEIVKATEINSEIPYLEFIVRAGLLVAAEIITAGQIFGRLLFPFHWIIGMVLFLLVVGGKYLAYAVITLYLVIKERHTFLKGEREK